MNKFIKFMGVFGVLLVFVGLVLADTESTTVTFVIPADIDHSVSYGGSCSSSNFYFVETDSNKDGTLSYINVTSDTAGSNLCQNTTVGAMLISNVGSVNVNVSSNVTSALPSGVVLKASQNYTGYQASCGATISDSACVNVSVGAPVVLKAGLTAQTGTQNIWWFADFSSFNSGVATTGVARTVSTIAVQE